MKNLKKCVNIFITNILNTKKTQLIYTRNSSLATGNLPPTLRDLKSKKTETVGAAKAKPQSIYYYTARQRHLREA